MMKRLTDLAKSGKGKELADKAKQIANDPATREKIEAAKRKLSERRAGGPKPGSGDAGGDKAA